ncbi:MAG: hypothetical protein M3O71_02675 [Bacteroidota bacterium]|nr:hypothetical protein [Bacteroidota bacterium]
MVLISQLSGNNFANVIKNRTLKCARPHYLDIRIISIFLLSKNWTPMQVIASFLRQDELPIKKIPYKLIIKVGYKPDIYQLAS